MKPFFTFTFKGLAASVAAVLLIISVAGQAMSGENNTADGDTNAQRIEFAQSLGYTLDESSTSLKKITVPQSFGKVYEKYNSLQKNAGFNLEDYKGARAVVYTYRIKDFEDEVFMNLMVVDGRIIGGDISNAALDGYMKPLCRRE